MNLNVVLRHELHDLINHASADHLFTALHSAQSPIRDRFIRFLALSYADWLSTQNNIDDDDIKNEWKAALQMPVQIGINIDPYPQERHDMSVKPNHKLKMREKNPFEGFVDIMDESKKSLNNNIPSSPKSIDNQTPSEVPPSPLSTHSDDDYASYEGNNNNHTPTTTNTNTNGGSVSGYLSDSSEITNVQQLFEALTIGQQQLLKAKLPLLQDATQLEKRNEILIKKLTLCATTFDFTSPNELELKAIEKKKQILTEILEYIARYTWYTEEILEQCIKTISCNLFRALPRTGKNPEVEDEPFEDPAWSHLQLIYDLTLRLVINTDVDKKTMKKYLEGEFVDNIIELFSSEDPREREYLKTILHRIYGRFMPLRHFIRQSIANCCYRTIYDSKHYARNENGIAEFLEIFCSIIHGFSIPVKKEHKDFLRNVLVPLHKCRKLEKFHEQLVACCVQFVFKDPAIAPVILGGLLKFWPKQSPTKEEMFIAEVVNVINALINHKNGFSWQENKNICIQVIDKLVKCMKSLHHSVAERALLVWSEDAIEALIDLDKKIIWPKIVGAFLDNRTHWNESLRECNEEAMDVFKVRDPTTFNNIRQEYERSMNSMSVQQQKRMQQRKKWMELKNLASQNIHHHQQQNIYVNKNILLSNVNGSPSSSIHTSSYVNTNGTGIGNNKTTLTNGSAKVYNSFRTK